MKILLVNYEYPPLGGGGGIAIMEFAKELARAHEVHVLTSGVKNLESVERHPSLNLTIHRVRVLGRSNRATASFSSMFAFLPAGIRKGNKLAKEIEFDVVNTWFAIPSGITGAAVAKKNKIPHVLTIIGGDIYDPSKWYSPHKFFPAHWTVKRVLHQANFHVAISSDIANRARQYFSFNNPIEVVPLGITTPNYATTTRDKLGLSDNKKYIAAIGRLVRRKDYATLIKAINKLKRDDVNLLIIGDGPELENLQSLSKELGISDRIHFKGFVSEEMKYQILSNSDIFALISLHEGFGIVYLEAMYCGLPIIAADEGGQIDILEDSVTGHLIPVGDTDKLTKALSKLLTDKHLCQNIGILNRQKFEQYTPAKLAERYIRIFDKGCVPKDCN